MINCLRLTEVRIPNHTVRHTDAHLECHYDLDGEALYSVKFYKDGQEFYRYVPRDMPPVLIFNQTGVTVDVSNILVPPSTTLALCLPGLSGGDASVLSRFFLITLHNPVIDCIRSSLLFKCNFIPLSSSTYLTSTCSSTIPPTLWSCYGTLPCKVPDDIGARFQRRLHPSKQSPTMAIWWW